MNNDSLTPIVALVSNAVLVLFGVDYYAMLWAFIGSLLALHQSGPMGRAKAVLYVLLSTLIGAAMGSAAVVFFGTTHRAFTVLCSLVGGVGSQLLVSALLQAALARIKLLGGGDVPADPSR